MNPVIDIYGVYIPFLGVLIIVSFILNTILQWGVNKLHLENYIWHRSLFSAATYFIILGSLSIVVEYIG